MGRLKSFALERRLAQVKGLGTPVLIQDAAKALLRESLDGRVLLVREFSHVLEETVCDIYGSLHMANHTSLYC